MALKVDYVVKETATNLARNISLAVASILTVAVSLSLVGAALVVRQGVENATARWRGGIEFIVFLQPNVTPEQQDSVKRALEESPQVKDAVFVDKQQTYDEFRELFKNSPQLIENVTPEILPPSYRVVPEETDAVFVAELGQQFQNRPGVRQVVFAFDTIRTIQNFSNILGWIILGVALALLVAATMLILNTIRMAMFARRREIEVMKLVGASNWFIRIPFMLEGVVASIIGSGFAVGVVLLLNRLLENLSTNQNYQLLSGFVVDSSDVLLISLFVVLTGVVIGAIGSAFAVSRYLDV